MTGLARYRVALANLADRSRGLYKDMPDVRTKPPATTWSPG